LNRVLDGAQLSRTQLPSLLRHDCSDGDQSRTCHQAEEDASIAKPNLPELRSLDLLDATGTSALIAQAIHRIKEASGSLGRLRVGTNRMERLFDLR
jgi:hypothetical protein